MLPVYLHRPVDRPMHDSQDARSRIAREQAFYDRYGSDSIVGLYRFILAVGELWHGPRKALGKLSFGKFRRYRDARLRPR